MNPLRIIIPGFILLILICFLPELEQLKTLIESHSSLGVFADIITPGITAIFLGAIYNILDIRGRFFWKKPLKKVQDNLKTGLLSPFKEDPMIKPNIPKLMEKRKIMHIFYHFIDNDKTLSEKAKSVYLNGLIWTSVIDVAAISLLGLIYCAILMIIIGPKDHGVLAGILLFTYLIFQYLLHPLVVRDHIKLGDIQVEYILYQYKDQLKKQIIEKIKDVSTEEKDYQYVT